VVSICPSHSLRATQPPKYLVNKKPATEKFPWLVGIVEQRSVCSVGLQANKTRLCTLNKNATGMGTPVADKLNQKDWLNCDAETRPWGYRKQVPILI
jgi:hypothetical protein